MSAKKEKSDLPYDIERHLLPPGKKIDNETAYAALMAMRGLCDEDFMEEYFDDEVRAREYGRGPWHPKDKG